MGRSIRFLLPLAAALSCAAASLVYAQGSGRSLDLEPSTRAAGMGGSSGAVFWGDDLNQWANPALIAYHRGFRYEWGYTRLVPDLAADATFRREIVKVGGGGIAVWTAGQPSHRLGRLEVRVPDALNHDFEHIRSWGWAVSAAQLAQSMTALFGGEMPDVARYGDLSFGMSEKDLRIDISGAGIAATTARDIGLLARATPLRSAIDPGGLEIPVRGDIAYGWSILSYNDALVHFSNEDIITPVSRHHRNAVALRVAAGWPQAVVRGFSDRHLGWLARGLDPMISIAVASDRDHITAGDLTSNEYRTTGLGVELGLANVLTLRRGSYEDKTGQIDDTTSGWSLGLNLGGWAGFRFDRGRFPEAKGLKDVKPKGFSAFVDPVAIWNSLR